MLNVKFAKFASPFLGLAFSIFRKAEFNTLLNFRDTLQPARGRTYLGYLRDSKNPALVKHSEWFTSCCSIQAYQRQNFRYLFLPFTNHFKHSAHALFWSFRVMNQHGFLLQANDKVNSLVPLQSGFDDVMTSRSDSNWWEMYNSFRVAIVPCSRVGIDFASRLGSTKQNWDQILKHIKS